MIKRWIFVFSIFLLSSSIANSNEKTVFVDIDFILNNSNLGKSIFNEIEKIKNINFKKLSQKEEYLKEKKDNINKTKNISSKEKLENDINLFNQEVKAFNEEKDLFSKKLNKIKQDEFKKFLKEINLIIQDYMKKNSIDIVFDKKQLFIGNSKNDITEDVLKLINKKFKNNG